MDREASSEGRFLAALAVGAAPETLRALWGGLEVSRRTQGILPMAARAGLLPSLGRFAARYAPADVATVKWVALGVAAEARTRACLELLERVATRAEVRESTPVAIKGAGMTLAGYYEPGERYSADADLVVPPESLPDWGRAAVRAGATCSVLACDGYEAATISDGRAVVDLHVALAGEAGRLPGVGHGALLASTLPPDPAHGIEGVRTPAPAAAREITVQHFVFHHQGSETHGFRTLQDLARLERDEPVAEELPALVWEGSSPAPATALLTRVAKRLKQGAGENDPECRMFLGLLLCALAGEEPTSPTYAEDVNRILNAEGDRGGVRSFRVLLRHLFPPPDRIRVRPQEPILATALRYTARPFVLALRYAASRRKSHAAKTLLRWRRFLEAGHV
ncbi:MAG: nucleotidyltransferase family protein [Thermoanaerobaculia bacterium]